MSELLKRDTTIKVLSILFAVILWFVVNPVTTKTISVPLTVRGEDTLKDKNILLKNKNFIRTIDIVIRGSEEKIKSVNGYDFEAILDFSKVNSADENTLGIEGPKYTGKEDGIIVQKVLQEYINIDLDRLEKNSFPIDIRTSGNLKAGYKMIEITAVPDSITLQGADTLIRSVDEIRTVINVNNIDRDTVLKKQACKVYDAEGNEITSLSKNLTVDIKVQVAKEVPVNLVISGKPAFNFTDGQRKVNPEKVLITGPAEILSRITELRTEPVSIEDVNKTVDTVSRLILPPGVKLVDIPREVAVSVIIEPLTEKKYSITKGEITLANADASGTLAYDIKTESIDVAIKGLRVNLSSININSLKPSIDVFGLGEGTHKVPLKLNLPVDIMVKSVYEVEVEVRKIQSAE